MAVDEPTAAPEGLPLSTVSALRPLSRACVDFVGHRPAVRPDVLPVEAFE